MGVLAGAGVLHFAALLTGLIVFINLGLRPIVRWIKRRSGAANSANGPKRILQLRLHANGEEEVRRAALTSLASAEIAVSGMERTEDDGVITLSLATERASELGGIEDLQRVLAALVADLRVIGAEIVQENSEID